MRRRFIRFTCVVLTAGLIFGSSSNVSAQGCGDHILSQGRAVTAKANALKAQLRRTGDCSLVPSIVALGDRFQALCLQRASQYAHCGAWCNPGKSHAQFDKELRLLCKTRPTTVVAQQESPNPANPKKDGAARSASCSDITGTNSKSTAAKECKTANTALSAARATRKTDPKRATKQYERAADSYRRAGDNAQADAILKEAAGQASVIATAPSIPSQAPSAKSPLAVSNEAAAMPSQPPVGGMRLWDGTRERCYPVNNLEKNTASWHVMCDPELPKRPASDYRPDPDPLELLKQARQACGSYSRDTQQCFADFKLKAILARNPGIRETCEKAAEQSPLRRELSERLGARGGNNRDKFLECVDNAYLYGTPDGPPGPKHALRDSLRKIMNATKPDDSKQTAETGPKPNLCWSPGRCCAPGHGLKPTPGGFGAWSCQPLGSLALNTTQPRLAPTDEAELIEDFEERVNDSVAKAVAAVLAAFGSAMSESDRDACAAASFAAVHAMLKGGAPNLPEQCRAMASGARAYFAAYADGHVDTSSNAMEDLLAQFRPDLGAPIPGLIGLTPDEQARRSGECLLRGSSAESCN